MSLINQMLKDLEARRQQQDNPNAQTFAVAPCYQKPQRNGVLLVVGIVTLIASVGLAGWWYLNRQDQVLLSTVAQVASSANCATAAVTGQPVVAATQEPVSARTEPSAAVVEVSQPSTVEAQPELKPEAVAVAPVLAAILAPERGAQTVASQLVAPVIAPALVSKLAEPISTKPAAAVQVSQAVSVPAQAQQIRVQAQRMLDQHQYPAAVKLLQRAITMAGATPVQWHQLAVGYLQARQLAAACRVVDSGCQQYPNDVSLRVLQARLLLETGNKHQALAALQLIEPAPVVATASAYYALLATVQQQSGDYLAAQKNYALLTGTFPQRGEWWIGRAICADQLGQINAATVNFHQALRCPQLQSQLKQYALQQLQRLAKG